MGRRRRRAGARRGRGQDRRACRTLHRIPRRGCRCNQGTLREFEGNSVMSDTDGQVPLPDLNGPAAPAGNDVGYNDDEYASRVAADLEAVFDVPVQVSAVLGRSKMDVSELLKLGPGTVLELDRRVGEAIDIYVNNRLVARGEVVLVEDKLGVTMTEIIKTERG